MIRRSALACVAVGLSAVVILGGCGGGSSSAAPKLSGVAAAGLPVAGGKVLLVDAAGKSASSTVRADGSYELPVKGLQAPFLVEVVGTAGGNPVVLHSAATAADLSAKAPVNVTPFTELIVAYVLQKSPAAVFRSSSRSLAGLTDSALQAASASVAAELAPLLAAVGVTGDLRTTAFVADGTGMDRALDALKLVEIQDDHAGAFHYELTPTYGGRSVALDPAAPPSDAVLPFGDADAAALDGAIASLPAIDAQLQALAARFATALPAAGDLSPFFAPEFKHNGLGRDDYLASVLLAPSYVGFTLSKPALEEIADSTHVSVSVRLGLVGRAPWKEVFRMDKSEAGVWQLAGNQSLAAISVSYMARLTSKGPTEEEIAAIPGVEVWNNVNVNGVLRDHCYMHPWTSRAGYYTLLGCAGDTSFAPYVLELMNMFSTADRANAAYRFLGHADAAVEQFLQFWVSPTQIDSSVDHIQVTGPGLPAEGLTLVRPDPQFPRGSFIFKGDQWNWYAFNDARCANIDTSYMTSCGLDWSAVLSGSTYLFQLFDVEGALVGTLEQRFFGNPRSGDEWLAVKDAMFPQLQLTSANALTYTNVLRTPFSYQGTETVRWSAPTDPTMAMDYVSMWRSGFQGNTGNSADLRQENCERGVYGATSSTASCTWADNWLATWAWIDIGAQDLYGNQLAQEVSPNNPY